MSNLGQYITNLRNAKKLSIRGLAELAHISHTEIARLENGERKNPSFSVLKSISNALGVSFNEIIKAAGYIEEDFPITELHGIILEIADLDENEMKEVKDFIEFLHNKKIKNGK
ncbi:MAG TPA: transcriptional regulator [Ruminiclostridium sp.]|nr:transcriptional regulator [Ruminiclostridium sp.]